jgi:hypothetical protein
LRSRFKGLLKLHGERLDQAIESSGAGEQAVRRSARAGGSKAGAGEGIENAEGASEGDARLNSTVNFWMLMSGLLAITRSM